MGQVAAHAMWRSCGSHVARHVAVMWQRTACCGHVARHVAVMWQRMRCGGHVAVMWQGLGLVERDVCQTSDYYSYIIIVILIVHSAHRSCQIELRV